MRIKILTLFPEMFMPVLGASITGRAILVGIEQAVREMLALMRNYQG